MDKLTKIVLEQGTEFTKTVVINFKGQDYEVDIKPVTDEQVTEAVQSMDLSLFVGMDPEKAKTMTTKEKEDYAKKVMEKDGGKLLGAMNKMYQVYCKYGIVDPELRNMVKSFKFGLTDAIGAKIEEISVVKQEAVQDFSIAPKAN